MAQEIADSKLIDTWSSSGLIVKPDISKIIEGWQLGEQPPHEYMNWLQNTFGSKLNHILKNGVASWNNTTQYLAGSSVQHNGNVWLCKTTNTNSAPTDANANWKRIITVESLTTVLGGYVALTGNQTIAGVKTFSNGVTMSSGASDTSDLKFEDPTKNTSFLIDMVSESFRVHKNFRDEGNELIFTITASTGVFSFAKNPIISETQSNLVNALTRKDYVDGLDSANVKLTGNQTISGVKTFSSTIQASISGNSGTVTNGVYTTGDQTIGGVKTFSSSPIVPTPTAGTQAVNKTYADLKVALTDFTGANQNFTQNGYQKLPGGLILQWGRYNGNLNDTYADITFPIQFPNAVYSLTVTSNTTTASGGSDFSTAGVYINNTSSFRLFGYAGGSSATTTGYYWFAIGI